jgi:hypothetical protein
MKSNIVPVLILCTVAFMATIQPGFSMFVQETKHLGKWEGTDNSGETAAVSFEKDGYAVLYLNGETMGEKRDQEPLVKYEFDYSKNPVWLDLIVCDLQGKERGRMKSIVKFLSDDQMLWRIGNDESTRPTGFDDQDKENTVLLKKVSKNKP